MQERARCRARVCSFQGKDAMEVKVHGRRRRRPRPRPFFLGGLVASALLLATLLPLGCTQGCNLDRALAPAPTGTPQVRVLVLEGRQSVNLSATEPPSVHVGPGLGRPINLSDGATVPV